MKKLGLIVFIAALSIGLIFTPNCSFGGFNGFTGTRGSGVAKTEQRNVSGFKRVEAHGAANVEIETQKDFSVSLETDDNLLKFIKTEVSGDTLKIYTEGKISSKTRLNVKISMPEIEGFDLSGASQGNIANLKTDSLELKASGASKINVSGEAKILKADASGASTINAEALRTEEANVEASGASKAAVFATETLNVEASGASKISYSGEPKNVKENSSGASSILKK